MRKTIVSMLLAITAVLSAGAQDFTRKGGISVNIGGEPALAGFNYYQNNTSDSNSLSGIYEPFTTEPGYAPMVSLTGEYILGRLLGLGADLCWTSYSVAKYNGVTRKNLGEVTVNGITFMPSVRAYWLNRDRFKLYSGLYGGVTASFSDDPGSAAASFKPAFEVVYLGIRVSIFGKGRIYGMAETMVGNVLNGGRFGIGIGF